MKRTTTAALLGAAALTTPASAQADANVTCVTGLHVIVARASNEAPGFGILGPVKDEILDRVPDSQAVWVPYPATITDPLYTESQPEGVGNLSALIVAYGDACPDGRMALLGYSQGAHVVGDALIGGDYEAFPALYQGPGVDQRYIDQVVAVIQMGDPANVAGEPFLVGNSTRDGYFPRNNTADWETTGVAGKLQAYCDAEDTYCDRGTLGNVSAAIHAGYVEEYGSDAADYVVSKAEETEVGVNATTTLPATSTATGTPSSTSAAPIGQTDSAGIRMAAKWSGPAVLVALGGAFAAAV